jgi:hypothetical protein
MFQIYRKIDNFLIKAFLITIVTCFSGYCGIKEAYTYLKQNQKVINYALSQCYPRESPLFNFPCNYNEMNYIKSLLENNSVNDSTIELTIREFLNNIDRISNLLDNRRTNIISDSISITFLSELINGTSKADEKERRLAILAAQEMVRWVSYPSLHKYKDQINAAVMNSCLGPGLSREIRIFTDPDESERQALLKERYSFWDAAYKARLGDSVAIEGLRAGYQNAKFFSHKESAIKQIFVSRQIELIKMVLVDFNNPMYKIEFCKASSSPCTSRTTQYETLQGLRRMHPEEKLINEDFLEMSYKFGAPPEQVKQYFQSVTKWMERKYAIKIEDKSTVYILKGACIR